MLTYASAVYYSCSNYPDSAIICWWDKKVAVVLNTVYYLCVHHRLCFKGIALMVVHVWGKERGRLSANFIPEPWRNKTGQRWILDEFLALFQSDLAYLEINKKQRKLCFSTSWFLQGARRALCGLQTQPDSISQQLFLVHTYIYPLTVHVAE